MPKEKIYIDYIRDILNEVNKVKEYVHNLSKEEFLSSLSV